MYAKTLIGTCLALALTATAEARPPRGGFDGFPPGAEQRVAWMTEELGLDDAQSAELLAILQQAEADREDLRERMEAQFKPEICALHDQVRADVGAVLTVEQAAELEERMERREARAGERRGRRSPPWEGCDA